MSPETSIGDAAEKVSIVAAPPPLSASRLAAVNAAFRSTVPAETTVTVPHVTTYLTFQGIALEDPVTPRVTNAIVIEIL